MHEYSNIRATLEEIKTLVILCKDLRSALILLGWVKISLEFVPESFSKEILETEINELEKRLKQPLFLMKKLWIYSFRHISIHS